MEARKNKWIDFHAHILPKADHGSETVEMSLNQLDRAKAAGIDLIIATPHFYPHIETVKDFLERRSQAFEEICKARKDIYPRIMLGAEVLLCPNMDRMEKLEELCIIGTNTMLIEMPFVKSWEKTYLDTLERIREKGIQVVLAHIERYSKENAEKVIGREFMVQINAESFRGLKNKMLIKKCLKEKCIWALGSDIHGDSNPYSAWRRAIKSVEKADKDFLMKTNRLIKNK